MKDSAIEWTHHTFNPWIGCQRVSPGCEHCYAEVMDKRVGGAVDPRDGVKKLRWGPKAPRIRTSELNWRQPMKWNAAAAKAGERHRVFCSSMADVFEDRPELAQWRADLFSLIKRTPQLDWLLLTKRPENVARLWPEVVVTPGERLDSVLVHRDPPGSEWPNIWLGTTVEDQQRATERVAELLKVPAAVRFLSCEPLLEAVNLRPFLPPYGPAVAGRPSQPRIDWVIIGGESGGNARRFEVSWALSLLKQCRAAGVAPFVKQMGSFVVDRNDAGFDADSHTWVDSGLPVDARAWPTPLDVEFDINGFREEYQGADCRVRLKDRAGGDIAEWPLELRVREFPR